MVQINFASREVSCKVVYYGPGFCGKTTSIQQVHEKAPAQRRGSLTSIATEGDRTLFFDFMPLELGTVAGMKAKFQLYTVPGQVFYNATRKIVLAGVDGIIFVADSSRSRKQANIESWRNLEENLREYGHVVSDIPVVIQFNKRDAEDAMSVEEMQADLNALGLATFETVAVTGRGVMPALRKLISLVLEKLNERPPRRGARLPVRAAGAPAPVAVEKSPVGEEAVVPAGHAAASAEPAAERSEQVQVPAPARGVSQNARRPTAPAKPRRSLRRNDPGKSAARPAQRGSHVTFSDEVRSLTSNGKILLVIFGVVVIVAVVVMTLLMVGGE